MIDVLPCVASGPKYRIPGYAGTVETNDPRKLIMPCAAETSEAVVALIKTEPAGTSGAVVDGLTSNLRK